MTTQEIEEMECCICYETIGANNNCTTPCGHKFCFSCMMQALSHNNSCPCCRAVLQEQPAEESDGDEYDDDEELDDEDSPETLEHDDTLATPEIISKRLADKGYNMTDLLSTLLRRTNRRDPRYTSRFERKLLLELPRVIREEDNDAMIRFEENEMMGEEDVRRYEKTHQTIFDIDPQFNLSSIFAVEA